MPQIVSARRADLSADFHEALTRSFEQLETRVREEVDRQVTLHVRQAVERTETATREAARRDMAGELNQACRRFRQAESPDAVYAALLETLPPACRRAAVFSVDGPTVRGAASRGLEPPEAAERFRTLEFPLHSAAAFCAAADSGEPVVSAASAAEVAEANIATFTHPADDRVYLFPLMVRQQIAGCLYVPAGTGQVDFSTLELLAGIAGAALEAVTAARKPAEPESAPAPAGLVSIAPAAPEQPEAEGTVRVPDWSVLPAIEQQAHARAQRLARVLVAEIRLYRPDAVRSGRARHDLYRILREDIDRARDNYYRTCFPGCQSMVDYLHLELVQSLANNELRVLGSSYPGPLRLETEVSKSAG